MKIGDSVIVRKKDSSFTNHRGTLIAIGEDTTQRDYIVQFKNPLRWFFFDRKDIKVMGAMAW